MSAWSLKRTRQCAKCPWRVDVNPHDIPNGYEEAKHCALKSTIADAEAPSFPGAGPLHVMACHETQDAHCVGWLVHQMGPGNNIGLRLRLMSCTNLDKVQVVGEQHETFEATLPK